MFKKKIKKTIIAEGMACEHCAKKVENKLKELDSINKVKVNLKKKEVIVTLNEIIDDEILKKLIEELEYKVIRIE